MSAPTLIAPRRRVDIPVPDLTPWLAGNAGLPGFWTIAGPQPGPHTAITALVHGNEIAGALVLVRLLGRGISPLRGRLSLGFANLDAFARFDPANPTASRYVDEDLNRLWCRSVLDSDAETSELRRARAMRPLIDTVDVLLDLHSMLWESEPLLIAGLPEKARKLALRVGVPPLVVGDEGHSGGRRLIDYRPFADPGSPRVAILVEAGQHWVPETVETMAATVARLLLATGQIDAAAARRITDAPLDAGRPRFAQVTRTITAQTNEFAFVHPYRGGDIVPGRNTLIALDGEIEIRTPHDDCLLVMPCLRTCRGHTAVRLARLVDPVPA
jgi:predicted deacylase